MIPCYLGTYNVSMQNREKVEPMLKAGGISTLVVIYGKSIIFPRKLLTTIL